MKLKIKHIIIAIVVGVVSYYGYFLVRAFMLDHRTEFYYTKCYWLFKESIRKNIDSVTSIAYVRDIDVYSTYNYQKYFHITVWEFKELGNLDIHSIKFRTGIFLDNIDFPSGEGFNKNVKSFPYTLVRFKLPFKNYLHVNLNPKSEILKPIESANYRGFFGNINKMSFSDSNAEHLILFDYHGRTQPTLFLFYKVDGRFFVLMVNSDKPFDESIINIFNLKQS